MQAKDAKHFIEIQRLNAKVQCLQRSLEQKKANDLGEDAEVDLFKYLTAAFKDDRIWRVGKGVAGPDIHHVFVHNGKEIAKLVLDSKNRKVWQWDSVTKLGADQRAAKADHAILTTWKLPKDKHEVMEHNGVFITKPAHVVFLVGVLRRHSIQVAALRTAGKDASGTKAKLFALVTSGPFQQNLKSLRTIRGHEEDLTAKEKTQHEKIWKERKKLNDSLKAVTDAITADIDDIIDEKDEED